VRNSRIQLLISNRIAFEPEFETFIHPPTYSPIHLLFFFLLLPVAARLLRYAG
jgi:hypothetical protein